jgi:predicted acylesterase/phospholipase RssA
MPIKHLVISGGGPTPIRALGAAQHLEINNVWKIDDIETIYATSAGAILGVILCLRFDWETINTYIINRPWHEAFPLKAKQILEAYSKKGLFDNKIAEKIFSPLFNAKDIPLGITLKEFYELSRIEIHLFSLEINKFEIYDISYKTHPDLALFTAIHMSLAIPIIITPTCSEDKCFIDGGVVANYPLSYCLKEHSNIDEILSFKNEYEEEEVNNIKEESTLLEFLIYFLGKLVINVDTELKQQIIPNQVSYKTPHLSFDYLKKALSSCDLRKELLQSGIDAGQDLLDRIRIRVNAEIRQNAENNANNNANESLIVNPEENNDTTYN